MHRLEGFTRRAGLFAVLGLAGAAFMAPLAGWSANQPASLAPTIANVAAQLGVKITDRESEEFVMGVQFTGTLTDTLKFTAFGLKGFAIGARVTVARIAQDRVHIEADELDPPRREFVRVGIDTTGKILPPTKP